MAPDTTGQGSRNHDAWVKVSKYQHSSARKDLAASILGSPTLPRTPKSFILHHCEPLHQNTYASTTWNITTLSRQLTLPMSPTTQFVNTSNLRFLYLSQEDRDTMLLGDRNTSIPWLQTPLFKTSGTKTHESRYQSSKIPSRALTASSLGS